MTINCPKSLLTSFQTNQTSIQLSSKSTIILLVFPVVTCHQKNLPSSVPSAGPICPVWPIFRRREFPLANCPPSKFPARKPSTEKLSTHGTYQQTNCPQASRPQRDTADRTYSGRSAKNGDRPPDELSAGRLSAKGVVRHRERPQVTAQEGETSQKLRITEPIVHETKWPLGQLPRDQMSVWPIIGRDVHLADYRPRNHISAGLQGRNTSQGHKTTEANVHGTKGPLG